MLINLVNGNLNFTQQAIVQISEKLTHLHLKRMNWIISIHKYFLNWHWHCIQYFDFVGSILSRGWGWLIKGWRVSSDGWMMMFYTTTNGFHLNRTWVSSKTVQWCSVTSYLTTHAAGWKCIHLELSAQQPVIYLHSFNWKGFWSK